MNVAMVGSISILLFACTAQPLFANRPIETEKQAIGYEIVTDQLSHPWAMVFLPDGAMLITEKNGKLRYLDAAGNLDPMPIQGLPDIRSHGQGGLLDVTLHPEFESNRYIYISYAERTGNRYGTTVMRGKLKNHALEESEVIFRLSRKTKSRQHFGSRLVFDKQGFLFITLGDRGDSSRAQDLADHAGSLIRLHDDGRIPKDNPFLVNAKAKPEIYSYGHRNIQGAALHPVSGSLWTHEHGPQGGDEINIPAAGRNYGWPIITYGVNYVIGTKIGEGTHKAGMEQPLHTWIPSIAPSGMTFYTGEQFPQWKGNLFVGSLKFQQLVRLEIDNNKITHEERLLSNKLGRIRDVRQGPDGMLYLLTDERNGKLVRILPKGEPNPVTR
ncbi:MAG: PQQ-dependent sugar dehydrogenase [Candidatus Thiodiazotropha lotti]|uniref:PQQ-dependent sugar dehydrogenase n=1 Tax=Candidatus Thiodiazotropha lotti TaxID=2792787 RepID=A0A9E4MYS5_9GAMM|nr:PQQ-dependent sugar dehydrogenase [Candidatus Thiodiazotropha lotti]MCG7921601.1 PQQ-dependent sugar dehydrogenase [Candidatus Thiodiazotropha lotti]MCG7929403.1 PQQ-dependent sugar dehydrogenase [Candidatus Thiodiazotropha lotti]MCG7938011.1 PQQ-dependent sugar dehydrogenase [Candidatus Thiodiazotropha lotti]MCG7989403.1 PQQ-dependent sugar dehydrogenase [Candidatus Thiodiazotropha lotti]